MEIRRLEKEYWPERLGEIPEPPKQLYIRGELPVIDHIWISIVGSRKYTDYGRRVCERIIRDLAGYPVVIVSGLAYGIDSIAHEAALEYNVPTCAVPGSGLDPSVLYPRRHSALARRIVEQGGCLVSEFESNEKAMPWMFPKRNRIMAGLSHAVVIVEASQKSGTMITARLGCDYNREIFVVPGRIDDPQSEGPLMLLGIGAQPLLSAQTIIDTFPTLRSVRDQMTDSSTDEHAGTTKQTALNFLHDEEAVIYQLLQTPMTHDVLYAHSPFPKEKTRALITMLEIKGMVTTVQGVLCQK